MPSVPKHDSLGLKFDRDITPVNEESTEPEVMPAVRHVTLDEARNLIVTSLGQGRKDSFDLAMELGLEIAFVEEVLDQLVAEKSIIAQPK